MTVTTTQRSLFGGAILIDLPPTLIDAADLRQVPDNQEVLLDPASDRTWILEVIATPTDAEIDELLKERGVEGSDEQKAVRFHFASLAHDNDATAQSVSHVWAEPPSSLASSSTSTPSPHLLVGVQHVSKFAAASRAPSSSEAAATTDRVRVHVALYRLPSKGVDLVLSQNVPFGNLAEHPEGQAQIESKEEQRDRDEFDKVARSLNIRDWGLFA